MSKASKKAIKALPALRASLIWFKRETVRQLQRRAQDAASPRLQAVYLQKVSKVRRADLADLRASYQAERASEIASAHRFELSRAIPGIVWLGVGGAS